MRKTTRGKRLALLAGVLAVVLFGVGGWVGRDHFRFWWLFESIGTNEQGYAEYRQRQTGIVFVRLAGGTFHMGKSSEEIGQGGTDNENSYSLEPPRHRVTLSPFLIAKYEVSQSEWRRIMEANPSSNIGDNLPVEQVSSMDCREFCQRAELSRVQIFLGAPARVS